MNKKNFLPIICFFLLIVAKFGLAEQTLSQRLSGQILLQVENFGEAWYLNPDDLRRYYMGRPQDAFDLMRNFGIGITNQNLEKIPIGLITSEQPSTDTDQDGLSDAIEQAIGTDSQKKDTDEDGYDDKEEIKNVFNPLSSEKLNIDDILVEQNLGKIFLQVENFGEAWYLNPQDKKRYYLGRPQDAFDIMRKLSLGITNKDLEGIIIGEIGDNSCLECKDAEQTYNNAIESIRIGEISEILPFFSSDIQVAVESTMNFLDEEGKFYLANIMSEATLDEENSTQIKKIYSAQVDSPIGGQIEVNFNLEKQENGGWLLINL